MRMRLGRATDQRHDHGRARERPAPPPQGPPVAPVRSRVKDPLAQERRMRDAGGPLDNATYGCSCGLIFEAAVSTGVRCPACGNHQAW